MIPASIRVIDILLLKSAPIIIRGHASEDPILATGTSALLKLSGAYPFACWIACPHSWAATPTAATDVELHTESDRLSVLFDGL